MTKKIFVLRGPRSRFSDDGCQHLAVDLCTSAVLGFSGSVRLGIIEDRNVCARFGVSRSTSTHSFAAPGDGHTLLFLPPPWQHTPPIPNYQPPAVIRHPSSIIWFRLPSRFHFEQSDLIYRASDPYTLRSVLILIPHSIKYQISSSVQKDLPLYLLFTHWLSPSPPFDLMITFTTSLGSFLLLDFLSCLV